MFDARRGSAAILTTISLLMGCASANDDGMALGESSQELSVCNETVPGDRYIDGLPAYAQCAGSENSAIYSNNGIDTSTTALGPDWVRTQYSGGYQCTELAHRYWLFKWGVKWLPNGNAGSWCDTIPPATSGVVQTSTPVHGDLIVLGPGSCGAGPTTGHVAVIDSVDGSRSRVTVVQQNYASRGTYAQSCAKCYLHVVANTSGAGTGGAPSGTGGAGGSIPVPPGTGATPGCSLASSEQPTNATLGPFGLLAAFLLTNRLRRHAQRRFRSTRTG